MANYFVDSTTGSDGDNGTTMDLAWATLEHALTAGGLAAGDYIWIRRIHDETVTGVVNVAYSGDSDNHIKIVGWPRPTLSITSATWTNASRTVSSVVGVSMLDVAHIARYIIGPDGNTYIITYVDDSATFRLNIPYIGQTVSGSNGAATISADEEWVDDMGAAYGFDDSAWTIKESTWDADAHAMPEVSMSGGAYYIYHYADMFYYYANIHFDGGSYASGSFYYRQGATASMRGIYFTNVSNGGIVLSSGSTVYLKRFVAYGDAGSGSYGLYGGGSSFKIEDVILDNIRYAVFLTQNSMVMGKGLHIGLNAACIVHWNADQVSGNCVKIKRVTEGTPSNQYINIDRSGFFSIGLEDYQVLGGHKVYNNFGTITKTDVVEGSGDPEKRSGGADSVLELLYDWDETDCPTNYEFGGALLPIFDHEFEVDDSTKSYRYYVQADGAVAADDLWIEVEYVSDYSSTTEYITTKTISANSITARSGADDWSQYVEVNNITPAVASKVRIKCYCRYYHATNKIYIDPQVRVS